MSLEAEVGYFLHEEIALELSEDEQNLHENKPLASFEEDFSHDQLESGAFDNVHKVGCKRKINCTLCGDSVSSHLQRHMLRNHLPWYFSPTSACWHCKEYVGHDVTRHVQSQSRSHLKESYSFSDVYLQLWCQLMYGILVFFASRLQLGSVTELLQIVLLNNLFPNYNGDVASFDAYQMGRLGKVCETFELPIPETFAVSPPNHLVCILHWKIVVNLLHWIRDQTAYDVCQFKSFFGPFLSPVFNLLPGPEIKFVDSHCHLDKIIQTIGVDRLSILEFNLSPLQFCVSNFVFPTRWKLIKYFKNLRFIHSTIGVHPHAVIPGEEQRQVTEVAHHLKGGDFIGVGEVGLDFYSCRCRCTPTCTIVNACIEQKKQAQRLFLREVLPLAKKHDLTLVLHCRDDGDGAAAREVLNLLKETKLTELRIHRHCFTGSVDEMHDWLNALPNVMFGITSKSLTDPLTLEALSELELGKIVLETDSPYLKMSVWETDSTGVKTSDFSPCDVYRVAHILSRFKNVTLSVLCHVCNGNAKKLYALSS